VFGVVVCGRCLCCCVSGCVFGMVCSCSLVWYGFWVVWFLFLVLFSCVFVFSSFCVFFVVLVLAVWFFEAVVGGVGCCCLVGGFGICVRRGCGIWHELCRLGFVVESVMWSEVQHLCRQYIRFVYLCGLSARESRGVTGHIAILYARVDRFARSFFLSFIFSSAVFSIVGGCIFNRGWGSYSV
jgi:hypothetical protein